MKVFIRLAICIVLCQMAGVIGSIFTTPAIQTWYEGLSKPSFRPPNWVFAPVWITLYTLMGISAFLVWQKSGTLSRAPKAIAAFGLQLLLNALWSAAFFGLKSPTAGAIVIIALFVAILWMIKSFYPISQTAAYLQIPYAMWVAFASALNFSILALN